MAGKAWRRYLIWDNEEQTWEGHLAQVLLTKCAEVVEKATHVMEEHGYHVKEELKGELWYSSTYSSVFQILHCDNLIVTHAPTA